MFEENAHLYDLIYHDKDYASEARQLRDILASSGISEEAAVLEAACGTGSYLHHLDEWFETAGFDISPSMIELASDKLDDAELFVADMVDFDVDEPAAALLCVFSSIGYMHGEDKLRATLNNFHRALEPGGIAIVEPWIGPEDIRVGHAAMNTYEDDEVKLCRQLVVERDGRMAILDFHWLVAETGGEVEHFTDRHEMYLYTHNEYLKAFEQAGFEVNYDDEGLTGRGLYIGRKH